MANRKYTNIVVSSQVYCTSTSDYWFTVFMTGGVSRHYDPTIGFDSLNGVGMWGSAPRYLVEETNAIIKHMAETGYFKIYEKDRDGNKRFENLRYHDPVYFYQVVGLYKPTTSEEFREAWHDAMQGRTMSWEDFKKELEGEEQWLK